MNGEAKMDKKQSKSKPVATKRISSNRSGDMVAIYRSETRKLPKSYPSPYTLIRALAG